ncbi:hypothetical protein GGX14DRAFT_555606 [Mycena pura]|uniref:Uncharacterized protein n=1 Tax=Mycena pura TaxID=153505 RepID=A0AAD7E3S0_9AGAR|nr:hypothetical protein GGX14DRAFT_555606 [Mycena pura]
MGRKGKTPPYDASRVPDAMPLPSVSEVVLLKHEEVPIPDLNEFQRSYIIHEILPKYDLSKLDNQDREAIKKQALASKPFQHISVNAEAEHLEEETEIPKQMAACKRPKQSSSAAVANNALGADADAQQDKIRGFVKWAWRKAIGTLLKNKKYAEGRSDLVKTAKGGSAATKTTVSRTTSPNVTGDPTTAVDKKNESAAFRLLKLRNYTPRDKFSDVMYDNILAYARDEFGGPNGGADFQKAEKLLWAREDEKVWAARLAADEEHITAAERMAVLKKGVVDLLTTLTDHPRFPPFVATLQLGFQEGKQMIFEVGEAIPEGAVITPGFKAKHDETYEAYLRDMHSWSAGPLRDLTAAREHKKASSIAHPVFELDVAQLNDISLKDISILTEKYLVDSFEHAFQTRDVPWPTIKNQPNEFFDSSALGLSFALDYPPNLTGPQRVELASALIKVAGVGCPNLFRKQPDDRPSDDSEDELGDEAPRKAAAAAAKARDAEAAAAARACDKEEAARKAREEVAAAAARALKEEEEAARKAREEVAAAAARALEEEEEAAMKVREAKARMEEAAVEAAKTKKAQEEQKSKRKPTRAPKKASEPSATEPQSPAKPRVLRSNKPSERTRRSDRGRKVPEKVDKRVSKRALEDREEEAPAAKRQKRD